MVRTLAIDETTHEMIKQVVDAEQKNAPNERITLGRVTQDLLRESCKHRLEELKK